MLGPLKLPDFANGPVPDSEFDPEIHKLDSKPFEINQKLKAREVVDDQLEDERSPSSAPIYNDLGIMVNTREARHAMSDWIQKNPIFWAPSDYKPPRFYKKLYIPVKEYPGYNFIGLIIGPQGHTQKKMEKESGARILLRGKGSSKLGKVKQHKDARPDRLEDEDLHVYIEADSEKCVNAAMEMVEKLLIPVEEEMNTHKQAQLRELAELKATPKVEKYSHAQKMASKTNPTCSVCDDVNHLSVPCPLTVSTPTTGANGGFFPLGGPFDPNSAAHWMGNPALAVLPSCNAKPAKETDEAKLFVGFLPQSISFDKLIELFSPFGHLCEAIVIRDKTTGLSKGYGFLKYTNPRSAAEAVAAMNGYKIDGKRLAVRVAGQPPSTTSNSFKIPQEPSTFTHMPSAVAINQGDPGLLPAAITKGIPGPLNWPSPSGSMLREHHPLFHKRICIPLRSYPLNRKSLSSFGTSGQHPVSELVQFPGYLRSPQDYPYQLTPFHNHRCFAVSWQTPDTFHAAKTSTLRAHLHASSTY